METYLNTNGVECVMWSDEQGTYSMTKEAYDKQQAEQSTPNLTNEPAPKS
jgi:hypothetical protein